MTLLNRKRLASAPNARLLSPPAIVGDSARRDDADVAPSQDVTLDADGREVGRDRAGRPALSSVWMFSGANLVLAGSGRSTRPPAMTGTDWPLLSPICRLKNMTGTSPGLPPLLPKATPPNAKMPCPSRKKSRFSGKKRLNRVRFTCC